jgi:hypothetical protein
VSDDWVKHAQSFAGKMGIDSGPVPLGRWMDRGNPGKPVARGQSRAGDDMQPKSKAKSTSKKKK